MFSWHPRVFVNTTVTGETYRTGVGKGAAGSLMSPRDGFIYTLYTCRYNHNHSAAGLGLAGAPLPWSSDINGHQSGCKRP